MSSEDLILIWNVHTFSKLPASLSCSPRSCFSLVSSCCLSVCSCCFSVCSCCFSVCSCCFSDWSCCLSVCSCCLSDSCRCSSDLQQFSSSSSCFLTRSESESKRIFKIHLFMIYQALNIRSSYTTLPKGIKGPYLFLAPVQRNGWIQFLWAGDKKYKFSFLPCAGPLNVSS